MMQQKSGKQRRLHADRDAHKRRKDHTSKRATHAGAPHPKRPGLTPVRGPSAIPPNPTGPGAGPGGCKPRATGLPSVGSRGEQVTPKLAGGQEATPLPQHGGHRCHAGWTLQSNGTRIRSCGLAVGCCLPPSRCMRRPKNPAKGRRPTPVLATGGGVHTPCSWAGPIGQGEHNALKEPAQQHGATGG